MTTETAASILDEATGWLDTEQCLVREEYRSLTAFESQVETIGPSSTVPASPVGSGPAFTVSAGAGSNRLARIRTAYRETVMAVDHYNEEYGDSLPRSLEVEFGAELATALVHGSELTVPIYRQLRRMIARSRRNRVGGCKLLEAEQEALTEVRRSLKRIDDELDELVACPPERWTTAALELGWARIEYLHRQCEELARDHQQRLREQGNRSGQFTGDQRFEIYLYSTLSTDYPGLTGITLCSERVRDLAIAFGSELGSRAEKPESSRNTWPQSVTLPQADPAANR